MLSIKKTIQAVVVMLLFLTALCEAVRLDLGDGNILRRSKEDTCHACHKTDQNAPNDNNSIKTHSAEILGSCSNSSYRRRGDCLSGGGTWTPNKWVSQGGWGVEGGKYGKFVCTTCHTAHGTVNIYLIRESIKTPDNTTWATSGATGVGVDFRTFSGTAGITVGTMGDDNVSRSSSSKVCEACHSQNKYHNYNSANNSGGADHHNAENCVSCHSHKSGFAHGGGSGAGCGTATTCHGTRRSHPTHVNSAGGRGLSLACSECHDTNNFPSFKDGQGLANTTACNGCHSPGGTYDGVNDAAIGAKNNWTAGVYSGNALKSGKEKWCAGCHDSSPSVIDGVSAPNVAGNESGAYDYGTGWGFYKTGHGLPVNQTYPASGGRTYGAGKNCDACHDLASSHIDNNSRTYSAASDNYQAGYRLKSIGGQRPMNIPRPNGIALAADDFKLCLSCHDSNKYLLQSPSLVTTGFRDDRGDAPSSGDSPPINAHNHHLDNMGLRSDSDWDGSLDSQISCTTCHNAHGSTRLAMVNDGKLVNREPGLIIYYAKDGTTTYNPPTPPAAPDNYVTLDQSDGSVWSGTSAGNICSTCHGGNYGKYYRTPPAAPQAPSLAWTGESGYTADGVSPDSGQGGAYFTFRVKYTEVNYQLPRAIQVWVDRNDNGIYEDNEKFDMQEAEPSDIDCSNGKLYTKTLSVPFAGDGSLNYRFYASSGALDATGAPTSNSAITVGNNAPVLSWTGESGYTADGVSPDSGLGGSNFEFRIQYTDADNNTPSVVQVWTDENDNGVYEEGEKYNMTAVDAGDTDYTNGKLYYLVRPIAFAGDGSLKYRFYASDGTSPSTGIPTTDFSLSVTASNTAPSLSWTGEANYALDGVHPNTDAPESDFTFRVGYSDAQNSAPSVIQVWVDENGNGIYEAGEKYNMTAVDAADTDYTNGKLYTKTLRITGAGNGIINYRFYASDGSLDATGDPASDSMLTVIMNALTVSCSGGKDYTTIQAAVNAASNGDTILVSDCTYTEKVTVDNKDITVKSVNGASVTIIDGGGSGGAVVKFQSGADSTLNGFTVRNGAGGSSGGGIYISASSPTIVNSKVTGNDADNGGGIYVAASSSTVTISDSSIDNNTTSALDGAGLYLGSGSSAVISGSTFSGNTGRNGGGIYMTTSGDGSLSVTGSVFSGNRATGSHGGAVYVSASGGTMSVNVSGTTFTDNDGSDYGGAMTLWDSGAVFSALIDNSTFRRNNTTAQGSPLDGGALYISNLDSVAISGSVFDNNTARYSGAIQSSADNLTITDSSITGNTATSYNGGGLMITGGAVTVERTTVSGNRSGQGGAGVYMSGGTATFTNCMVTGNKTDTLQGGGFYFNGASVAATLTNCTIAGNYAAQYGGAIGQANGASVTVNNSIVWNNRGTGNYPDIAGTVTVSYSDVYQSVYPGSGNISINPAFAGAIGPDFAPTTSGNYHLSIDSPVVDAGSATGAPADDIDGNVRPIGSGVDMGADEVVTVANNAPLLTWTGETGFTSDGVSPDVGASGAAFEFRVNYSDSDNNTPSVIQVWVDKNDNGVYEADEKFDMTAVNAGDTNYTDGKLYTKTLDLTYAGDGILKYRFYAADGYVKATGAAVNDKTVVLNDAPTLSWIGSGNFVNDGAHPDSGPSGSNFEFRVRYTDANNNPPTSIQVWVDKNDNGVFDADEKFTMSAINAGDLIYSDGKDYTRTVTLTKAGDGIINYRFYASDGLPATGSPTANSAVTVTNNVPSLGWTGEANYITDGVDPNSAISGSGFTFRVKYTDGDNEAPTVKQVWVDANNNGTYEENEKYDMSAVDAGDTTYTDGKLYTKTLTLNTAGSVKYRSVFSDGFDAATGAPASDSTVSVTGGNTPPVLDWTGENGYITDGADPDIYSAGTNFTFRVKYTDAENTAPAAIQVWVDKDDNATYEAVEKYDMTAVDAGDTNYSDGKLYTATVRLMYAGDGVINYRFYAHDGTDSATGSATADKTLTVVNAKTVCASGCEYDNITAAIAVSSNGNYILVDNGTYSENINYADKSITIVSMNGPSVTKIQGTGANSAVVTFGTTATAANGVLDGFKIDNQAAGSTATRGIAIGLNDNATIKNCIIEGNVMSTGQNGAGIRIDNGTAAIVNTTIGGNASNKNSCASGCGLYATGLIAPLTISNSIISENTGTANGAGIYLVSNGAQPTIISGTTFTNNTATQSGGAIYNNSVVLSVSGSGFTSNTAGANQNGGAIYSTGAGASTTIDNSTFTGNSSGSQGGSVYMTGSTAATPLSISNSAFTGSAATAYGGTISLATVTNAAVITSTSISNSSSGNNKGGGIYLSSAPLTLTNTDIDNCTAGLEGGGIFATGATSVVNITGGSITRSTGTVGGGINLSTSATLTAAGTTISGNKATSTYGGGIYAGSSVTLTKSVLSGNRTNQRGGGIYVAGGTTALTNCNVTGNTADGQSYSTGGGIHDAGGTVLIYNSTFAGNYATSSGGGLYVSGTDDVVRNSVFWGNTAGSNAQIGGTPTTTYTDIQSGCSACLDKTGNIDANPQFINLQQASSGSPTTAGNYRLCYANGVPDAVCTSLSPCIDSASGTNAPADDIDGQSRPYNGAYDMGADEYVP